MDGWPDGRTDGRTDGWTDGKDLGKGVVDKLCDKGIDISEVDIVSADITANMTGFKDGLVQRICREGM